MLLCEMSLAPDGCLDDRRPIGEVLIRQNGGDHQIAHYAVTLQRSADYAAANGPFRTGQVVNFNRTMLGPYDLLLRGLIATVGGRSHLAVRRLPEGDIPLFDDF